MYPPEEPGLIRLPKIEKGGETLKEIGKGFAIQETLAFQPESGDVRTWIKQWFVVQSHTYASIQNKACLSRIEQAEIDLQRLKPKKSETADRCSRPLDAFRCAGEIPDRPPQE